MPKKFQSILTDYVSKIQKIYGSHLKSVILYGSYARGDFTPDSDIDIMILVDLKEKEINSYFDQLSELGFQYNIDYGIWIMPIVKNADHFRYWMYAYPFYKNVHSEGVTVYEAA